MFQSAIIFGLLFKSIASYSQCSNSDAKGPIEIPIRFILDPRYTPARLSGNIIIEDGCTFSVTKLQLINVGEVKVMGGNGSDPMAITLSMDQLLPSVGGGSQTFKFRSDAGAQASFKDFTEFRIFDWTNQVVLGVAEVPKNLKGASPAPPTNPTQPAQSTSAQSSSAPTLDVGNQASSPSGSTIGLNFLLAYILFF